MCFTLRCMGLIFNTRENLLGVRGLFILKFVHIGNIYIYDIPYVSKGITVIRLKEHIILGKIKTGKKAKQNNTGYLWNICVFHNKHCEFANL